RFDADRLEILNDVRSQIVKRVHRRQRHIAFLCSNPVSQILFAAAGVPKPFARLEVISRTVYVVVITDLIEDEELGFRSEETVVGKLGQPEIILGPSRNSARIHLVALAGYR